ISRDTVDAVAEAEQRELERRERAYRGERTPAELFGRTVILVDDGLATGASMRAALESLRSHHRPARIVVAAPVAAREACRDFEDLADAVVCAQTPDPFHAVGCWYDDFSQTSDLEVRELLALASDERRSAQGAAPP
ncbi:MAG: phosphoribosyltransferase, partial [Myxococcaceae bacterium]|nr:phosphoribosyltransferase [Myxococcaceae bacterium]